MIFQIGIGRGRLQVISRAVRPVKFETILKYQACYLCKISRTNHANNCYILLLEKFLQFDWLRAVEFQLNLKYLHVKINKYHS